MNCKLTISLVVVLCLCSSASLNAQLQTTNGRHYTLPRGVTAAIPVDPAQNVKVPLMETPSPAIITQPVIMNFDYLPQLPIWQGNGCGGGGGSVSNGILTLNSPTCYEYDLSAPNGFWHQYVNNARGWIIETGLKVDPSTQPFCGGDRGAIQIWANDHTNLIIVGFSTNEICLAYPDNVTFTMDTTNAFHVYRIESKGMRVKIFVDGSLAIDHILSWPGGGSNILSFGDGTGADASLSYWDYFSYDVFQSPPDM